MVFYAFQVSLVLCVAPAVFGIIVRDPPPSPNDYKYSYNIEDPTTGDSKSQHEVRQGDVVTGAYTVLGPDGTKRTVEYTADAKHGFKAVLTEDPVSSPLVNQPPVPQQNYNTIQYQTTRPVYVQYQTPAPRPEYVQYQTPAPKPEYVQFQTSTPRPEYVQYQTPAPRPEYVQFQTPAPNPEYVHYQTPAPRSEYVQYQTPTPRPVYQPVSHPEPQNNYVEEQPAVYFTPQNEIEPRAPFDGQYFIPATANNKY